MLRLASGQNKSRDEMQSYFLRGNGIRGGRSRRVVPLVDGHVGDNATAVEGAGSAGILLRSDGMGVVDG